MKTFTKIVPFAVLSMILIFPGCKKFLETPPQGSLTQEDFPTNESDALLAVNATYTTLRNWYYNYGGYPILDIMSDDARKGSNPGDQISTVGPYDNFSITPSQDGLDRWWNALYQGIKQANVVINKVPDIIMDTTLRNRYLAEAHFLRAVFYFDLVRAWGGVQIVTTTQPAINLPRSSADDVYSLIISDLNEAIPVLPLKNEYGDRDAGRATKGAAQALLGKVYLFRKDYADAEPLFTEVINSEQYSLEPVFIDACGVNGNNGTESVLEVGAIGVDNFTGGGAQYANTQGVRGNPNRGWGFNRPSIDLRRSFEPGDPRFQGTIIDLGEIIDSVLIVGDGATPDVTLNSQGDTVEVECYSRKVWVPGTNTITQWAYHRRLIRFADVLLMGAEVLAHNGKPAQALQYLNRVRERARQGNNSILPDIITTDPTLLVDTILMERRHELAMEGIRYWDLIRTDRAKDVLGPLGYVQGKNDLLPIPQREIDLSQGSLTQNPNW